MSFDEFCEDSKTIDAVIRNLEVIGEAAKKISDTLKMQTTDISWRGMAGLRDRLIHNYFVLTRGLSGKLLWMKFLTYLKGCAL